jgi:hypothetical protein
LGETVSVQEMIKFVKANCSDNPIVPTPDNPIVPTPTG